MRRPPVRTHGCLTYAIFCWLTPFVALMSIFVNVSFLFYFIFLLPYRSTALKSVSVLSLFVCV